MIACLRTVTVPAGMRERYLAWIGEGRAVREAHRILGRAGSWNHPAPTARRWC